MKTNKASGARVLEFWKRNGVIGAIVLFVCVAVYLNWSYEQEAGKTLGEAKFTAGQTDPLVKGTTTTDDSQAPDASDPATDPKVETESSYFATARLNRQQARDTALTLLQDAVTGEENNEAMRAEANNAIQTMADFTVTEAQIENLVVAKGYTDCVAFIGEESISLAVSQPEGGITVQDTAKIVDVVQQTADFTAEQIKIIAVE